MASMPIYRKQFTRLKAEAIERDKLELLKGFTLLYYCGFRVSETEQFTLGEIRAAVRTGRIRAFLSKQSRVNKRSGRLEKVWRDVPFSKNGRTELAALLLLDGRDKTRDDEPFIRGYRKFAQAMNYFIASVLGKGYTSHGFRIAYITEPLAAGKDPAQVQHNVGHKNMSTTLQYRHVSWEDKVALAEEFR